MTTGTGRGGSGSRSRAARASSGIDQGQLRADGSELWLYRGRSVAKRDDAAVGRDLIGRRHTNDVACRGHTSPVRSSAWDPFAHQHVRGSSPAAHPFSRCALPTPTANPHLRRLAGRFRGLLQKTVLDECARDYLLGTAQSASPRPLARAGSGGRRGRPVGDHRRGGRQPEGQWTAARDADRRLGRDRAPPRRRRACRSSVPESTWIWRWRRAGGS